MKRLIYLFIVIIIIIFTSSALNNPSRTLSKQEVASLLYPDKHIEVDTLGTGHYNIKFMNGKREIKAIELKPELIGTKIDTMYDESMYDSDTTMGNFVERHEKIKTSYELKLSQERTKIAVKTNHITEYYHLICVILPDTQWARKNEWMGEISKARNITVYNEEGKQMYELEADEIGWKQNPGPQTPGPKRNIAPFVYIKVITDNGEIIISSLKGETIFGIHQKLISNHGKTLINDIIRGDIRNNNFVQINNQTYFLCNMKKGTILYKISKDGLLLDSLKVEDNNETTYVGLLNINNKVMTVLNKKKGEGYNRKRKIQLIDNMEIRKEIEITDNDLQFKELMSANGMVFITTESSLIYKINAKLEIEKINEIKLNFMDIEKIIYRDKKYLIIKNNKNDCIVMELTFDLE